MPASTNGPDFISGLGNERSSRERSEVPPMLYQPLAALCSAIGFFVLASNQRAVAFRGCLSNRFALRNGQEFKARPETILTIN